MPPTQATTNGAPAAAVATVVPTPDVPTPAAPGTGHAAPGPGPGTGRALAHEPALDGLRGLAVLVVVAFHLGRLDGGFLGVDLFFVLSGFLITALLVAEHDRTGRLDLRQFWLRRARRLLPALFLMLVGVAVLLAQFTPAHDRPRFRAEALATLGYVANWQRLLADVGYWDIFSVPSPLDHTWSLAIEEQFYLLWPLVALVALGGLPRLRALRPRRAAPGRAAGATAATAGTVRAGSRRRLLAVSLAGAGASFTLLALTYRAEDTNRAYFGTDTRIGATLLGAALALAVADRDRRATRPGPALEIAAWACLAVMAWSVVTVDGLAPWYYRGGLALFALAAVVVIRAVTGGPPGPLARALAWPPLRGLGVISYGAYLWHWPVIVFVTSSRTANFGWPLEGWVLDGARLVATLAASIASYLVVERPIRLRRFTGAPMRWATVVAVPVTVGAVLASTAGSATPTVEAIPPIGEAHIPVEGSDNPALIYPADIPPDATRVLLVGDSGVGHLGPAFAAGAPGYGAVVATSSHILCAPTSPEGRTRGPDGRVDERETCHGHRHELWSALAEEFDPDLVIYYLANAGGIADTLLDGEWVADCDPPYDRYIAGALATDARLLGAHGAPVVFTTSPYTALLGQESGRRIDCRNETYHRVAASLPGSGVLDLNRFVTARGEEGHDMLPDGVHLGEQASVLVTDWLLPQALPYARPHGP